MDNYDQLQAVFAKWEKRGPPSGGGAPQPPGAQKVSDENYSAIMDQGRRQWKAKFDNAGLQPPQYRTARYRRRDRGNYESIPVFNTRLASIAFYKTKPTIEPAEDKYRRPFMGRCCTCLPVSMETFFDEKDTQGKGLHNVLRVDTMKSENPWLTRTFHHLAYSLRRKGNFKYPNLSLQILTSPRVVEAIQKSALQELGIESIEEVSAKKLAKQLKMEERRAKSLISRICANISTRLTRFTGWFLHKLMGYLFHSVVIHKGQIEMLKQASQLNQPVIYLPTHRSHLDYILLTFLLWNNDLRSPHVAAGDNLNIPIFGWLQRSLGGYFIKRKLDSSNGKKDYVYRAVLHTYMEGLLEDGQALEFFLEGTRTRSGKILYPKGGLLSIVVDAYMAGVVPDVFIVPVSFSYEKLMEGNFCREQMGEPKIAESFWGAVKAVWRLLSLHLGNVRIDFGQPFSIKEYMEVSQGYSRHAVLQSQWEDDLSLPRGVINLSDSSSSLFGMEDMRITIQNLAEHVMYNCVSIQAVMSTHLLSFLMLTKHRQGAKLKKVVTSAEWLRDQLTSHKRDVGFSGSMQDVILYACNALGSHLIAVEEQQKEPKKDGSEDQNNNNADDIFLKPAASLPKVFELTYYANTLAPVFALEGFVAAAVCAEAGDELWQRTGHQGSINISKNAVLYRVIDLCHIFQYEFLFKTPCSTWEMVLSDALEQLVISDILSQDQDHQPTWSKRLSNNLAWSDEDSEDDENSGQLVDSKYQVGLESKYSISKLKFLLNVVGPLLEAYHTAVCNVTLLKNGPQPEDQFVKATHQKAKQRVEDGVAMYAESASMDSLRNAVRSLQQLTILECYTDEECGRRMLHLQEGREQHLDTVLMQLDSCRITDLLL